MPYVKIELTREGVTREQKQQLISGVTDLITNVLNKDPHLTHVVIQEIALDDWGYAGDQVSGLREKGITANPPAKPADAPGKPESTPAKTK